jgi:hypothetical protein
LAFSRRTIFPPDEALSRYQTRMKNHHFQKAF